MAASKIDVISVVVPVYNERAGLGAFHESLVETLRGTHHSYEIIYCDDGSTDGSTDILHELAAGHEQVKVISLSRNFGKEIATTAGLHTASGDAIITLDADGQHPIELIPEFIAKWRAGAKVVIGIRTSNQREGVVKRAGSKLFYGLFAKISGIRLSAGTSDYRLIDKAVQAEFVRMTERNRITRGLIDWLGYKQEFIHFKANARRTDSAGYSFKKLVKLAIDSAISLSLSPLYIIAYIGAIVLPVSILLGIGMFINYLLGDPLALHATGGAYLMVFILFLVGILLVSQGIIGLYLSHIHTETQNRPLYVIDRERSKGISHVESL